MRELPKKKFTPEQGTKRVELYLDLTNRSFTPKENAAENSMPEKHNWTSCFVGFIKSLWQYGFVSNLVRCIRPSIYMNNFQLIQQLKGDILESNSMAAVINQCYKECYLKISYV